MSSQYPDYFKEMDFQKLFRLIVVLLVPFLVILGILWFWQINMADQVENLRWLSNALMQIYAAVLALVPAIGLTLLSFSAGKYSTRLVKKLWKSRQMSFFFFSMTASIVTCYAILVSLSKGPSFSLEILGNSFPMVKFFIVLESLTIFSFILAVYLLLDDIHEAVAGHIDEVLSDLIRDIQVGKNTDEAFGDLFHVLASLAENRDLTSLRKAVEKLFDLVIENEEYYEPVHEMLSDICWGYERKNHYFCLGAMKKMMSRGYARVVKSGSATLINKCLDNMAEIENQKAFYELIRKKLHATNVDHKN